MGNDLLRVSHGTPPVTPSPKTPNRVPYLIVSAVLLLVALALLMVVAGCAPFDGLRMSGPTAIWLDRDLIAAHCQGQIRPVPTWCPTVEIPLPLRSF